MKLIKLSDDHYIVVDDSEIKEGDWYYDTNDKESLMPIYQRSQDPKFYSGCKKITHSTNIDWHEVYYIPLSEAKSLIGELVAEKRADDYGFQVPYDGSNSFYDKEKIKHYLAGYNQALEDNKEKKYTEDDLRKAIDIAQKESWDEGGYLGKEHEPDEIIQTLQPKTEWDVEFVDGRLTLV